MPLAGGSDANDIYHHIRTDATGRTATVLDADGASDQVYSASVGNHVETARWTYTVAAGTISVVEALYGSVSPLTTDDSAYVRITLKRNGGSEIQLLSTNGRTSVTSVSQFGTQIVMRAGDVLKAYSYNNDGNNRVLTVCAAIRTVTA